jgi:phosphoribosylamine-glycine ligase
MDGKAPAMVDGKVEDKRLMVSCGDYLVVATGLGEDVREAKKHAYQAVESVEVPNNLIYRTDIGDGMRTKIPKLQEYGFATTWRY